MDQAFSFKHVSPQFRVFCGSDALHSLPRELDRVAASRAVVVCGKTIATHPTALDRVAEVLGTRLVGVFDGVREHSPVPAVLAARDMLEELGADAVIAIGGGSAIVTARAATILHCEKRGADALCTRREPDGRFTSPRLLAAKLPQWVIPTIPTTAYAKAGSAIRDVDAGKRLALFDPKTRAQGIFIDPDLVTTPPLQVILPSAVNAFTMSIEALQSNFYDPIAEAQLTHALGMLRRDLPRLIDLPDDAEIRMRIMVGVLLCGLGSDHACGGLAQSLAHAAGARSQVANGIVEAMLLPHAMRFNAPVTAPGLERIATAFGTESSGSEPAVERSLTAVGKMLERLAIPRRLREVGIAYGDLPAIVAETLEDWWLSRAPRPAGREDLATLLDAAW